MEKDVLKKKSALGTNWRAVINYLTDALDYFENDSREAIMFRVQLELLLDRALWIRNLSK